MIPDEAKEKLDILRFKPRKSAHHLPPMKRPIGGRINPLSGPVEDPESKAIAKAIRKRRKK